MSQNKISKLSRNINTKSLEKLAKYISHVTPMSNHHLRDVSIIRESECNNNSNETINFQKRKSSQGSNKLFQLSHDDITIAIPMKILENDNDLELSSSSDDLQIKPSLKVIRSIIMNHFEIIHSIHKKADDLLTILDLSLLKLTLIEEDSMFICGKLRIYK